LYRFEQSKAEIEHKRYFNSELGFIKLFKRGILKKDGSISTNLMIQELKELKIEDTEEDRLEDLQKVAKLVNNQKVEKFWGTTKHCTIDNIA